MGHGSDGMGIIKTPPREAQDDYLDAFASPEVLGKVRSRSEDGGMTREKSLFKGKMIHPGMEWDKGM